MLSISAQQDVIDLRLTGGGPRLDVHRVASANHAERPVLAPAFAPRINCRPVVKRHVLDCQLAPSDYPHGMVAGCGICRRLND